jgi:hypothetical protein
VTHPPRTGIAVVPIEDPDRIPAALERYRDRELVVLLVGPADLAVRVGLALSALLAGDDEITILPPGTHREP